MWKMYILPSTNCYVIMKPFKWNKVKSLTKLRTRLDIGCQGTPRVTFTTIGTFNYARGALIANQLIIGHR